MSSCRKDIWREANLADRQEHNEPKQRGGYKRVRKKYFSSMGGMSGFAALARTGRFFSGSSVLYQVALMLASHSIGTNQCKNSLRPLARNAQLPRCFLESERFKFEFSRARHRVFGLC